MSWLCTYTMTASNTIYQSFQTDNKEFDIGKFIESIILFDTVLLSNPSVLPELIRATGIEGLLRLLNDDLLRVVGGGPSAQATYDFNRPAFSRNKALDRPLRFGFETVYVDPSTPGNLSANERLEKDLKKTKGIMSIADQDLTKIQDAIVPSMKTIDGQSLKTKDDFRKDILEKQEFIVALLVDSLVRESNLPIHALNWKINVEEVDAGIFQINTNINKILRISDSELHEHLKKPFFEITGTNLQLHRMRAVDAAAGLSQMQAIITAKCIDFLSKLHTESDTRTIFTKITEVANVPCLEPGITINVDELIKLRNSDEARSFRDWIQNSQSLDKHEIQKLLSGWRKKLGEMLKLNNAKGIRWLTSTGAGELISPATGVVVGGIDYFLGKFLPGMGPIGFIVGDYDRYIKQQAENK